MTEQDTKNKLLAAAKKEFLASGFRGASLRKICADAGVTTGALYFFFRGKEALFGEIVGKPLEAFEVLAAECVEIELSYAGRFAETEDRIICFLTEHREECILLLEKSEGTEYAGFRETWQKKLEEIFGMFFEKQLGHAADPAIVHLIASMRMHGYMELLRGGYTEEQARKLTQEMGVYADAGFTALIKIIKQGQ